MMPLRAAPFVFPALNPDSFHGLPGLLADSPARPLRPRADRRLAGRAGTRARRASTRWSASATSAAVAWARWSSRPRAGRARPGTATCRSRRWSSSPRRCSRTAPSSSRHSPTGIANRRCATSSASAPPPAARAPRRSSPGTRTTERRALRPARRRPGFEHWLLKFDGVAGNKDRSALADPQGYGAIEYAYSLMARDAGITMTECRLLEENGRRHFMTRRFDRDADGAQAAHAVARRARALRLQAGPARTPTSRPSS